MQWAPGEPCWIDLTTSNSDAARRFYAEVFGWTAGEASEEFGGYFMFFANGAPVAGCEPNRTTHCDAWRMYLATPDVDETLRRATAQEVSVQTDVVDVGPLGRMARVRGRDGALLGLWQAKEFAGLRTREGHGIPLWFELHTRDEPGARSFLFDTFGVNTPLMSDTDDFRYATIDRGGEPFGGLFDASRQLRAEESGHWKIYIGVDDVESAVVRASDAGGTIIANVADSPYGRFATVSDPTGAQVVLMQPPARS
jgi:predicted enzyme related to lactoylglutathione lyase